MIIITKEQNNSRIKIFKSTVITLTKTSKETKVRGDRGQIPKKRASNSVEMVERIGGEDRDLRKMEECVEGRRENRGDGGLYRLSKL